VLQSAALSTRSAKYLAATADTVHFGFHDGNLAAVLEIDDGDEIVINTVSADPAHDVPAEWLPPNIADIFARAQRGLGPHILTGPIAVRGARAGDVLQVDILDIRLTQPYGYNVVSPLKGMFGTEQPTLRTTIIPSISIPVSPKWCRACAGRRARSSGSSASPRRANGDGSTAARRTGSAATWTTAS
jgi:acetamidase/formamidase